MIVMPLWFWDASVTKTALDASWKLTVALFLNCRNSAEASFRLMTPVVLTRPWNTTLDLCGAVLFAGGFAPLGKPPDTLKVPLPVTGPKMSRLTGNGSPAAPVAMAPAGEVTLTVPLFWNPVNVLPEMR